MLFRAGESCSQREGTHRIDHRKVSDMNTRTLVAIILIAVGIVAFAYQGITYTTREKTVDLGPVHVTTEKTRTLPLPPIVGAITLIGGIVLLVRGSKKG